ncbi:hypothetical protein KYJ26_00110 [Bacillus sp. MCCB 382]|uniref:hypothetical protein n=1 Tax=Bacillus sp. MCCB 382 TaxID=2860197 RepID=UPI001C5A0C49|nr:hypothetical protein [Bacillus sp. MCCB 382]
MKILIYIMTVLNLLALTFLSLPFLAQSVQDLSPGLYVNIYMDPSLVLMIGVCCLIAIPLSSALYKFNATLKRRNRTLYGLLLLLVSIVLILYIQSDALNEIMNRPSYE